MSKDYSKFYYNQLNYSNVKYDRPNTSTIETIATSGCGICSTLMAINNLCGKELFTVQSLATLAINNGARGSNGTIMTKLLNAVCNKYPDFSYTTTEYGNKLIEHLKQGGVAILSQGDTYDVFSSQGHLVYAYGIESGTNIKVLDSAFTSTRYKKSPRCNRIVAVYKQGVIVNINQVNKATSPISYYLISYKGKYYGGDDVANKTDTACTYIKGNATMKARTAVYADNTRELVQVGIVGKNERVKVLEAGQTYSVIAYGVSKYVYKVGLVPKANINFD